MPLLGRISYELLVRKRISARANNYTDTLPSEVRKKYSEKVQQQFDYNNHNFWNTLYKQLTSNALNSYITECEKLGQINTHAIQVIWGEEDTEVTRKDIQDLQRLIPSVQLTAIPNKTHGLIGEAPLVVADFVQAIVKSV